MENQLRSIRKELKLTQEALARRLGIGKSALSMIETGKAALSKRNMNILAQEFNVNPEWIKEGKGDMFTAPPPGHCSATDHTDVNTAHDIPLYNTDTTSGLAALFADSSAFKPAGCIRIPNMTRCDGAVYVTGDGMYPMLKSGDIVLYKQINDPSDIFWGDMYLMSINIDGEEYVTVKFIHRSDKAGYVKLVSQNPGHEDKEIELSKIKALAFIKASIRMNSLG